MHIFKLLLTTHFDQVDVEIGNFLRNKKFVPFELALQRQQTGLHLISESKDMLVLLQLVCLVS